MSESSFNCPKCGASIELTEALKKNIQDDLRAEYNQRWLDEKKKIESQFATQKQQLEDQIKKQTEDQFQFQLKDIRNQLDEKSRKLKVSEDKELELLKQQRELENKERSLKLEMERQLSAERSKIQTELMSRLGEEYKLRDAEKEKTITDLYKQIDDLKRKAEIGSQQLQGEVLELELEEQLRRLFPGDDIEPVRKGARGGDIIQRITNDFRQPCGVILWEAKRARDWSKEWIAKLKEDKLEAKANLGVIVSTVLPKGVIRVGNIDNIWICDAASAEGLAMALRAGMIEVAHAHSSKENMDGKMEIMYNYLSGPEFRQKMEAIVEAFMQMKKDLDSEKTAMYKIWAKREKQVERVVMNTTQLYGSLQGIIGQNLKPIQQLELAAGLDDVIDPDNK